MADDNTDQQSDPDTPLIQLFIRASTIDRERKGSCPLCQQWFMAACILTEQRQLSFQVTIVDADSPPDSFKNLAGGRSNIPAVYGLSGRNSKGPIKGLIAPTIDEIEKFFDDFNCPELKRTGEVLIAQDSYIDLYQAFNAYLGNNSARDRLTHKFEMLNSYLESRNKRYLVEDWLTYADCYLMPKLHHIKVAAKEYKNYEIPEEFFYVWRYIYNMYNTLAFEQTVCTDQDITKHYKNKANCAPLNGWPSLQKKSFSFNVSLSVMEKITGGKIPDSMQNVDYEDADDGDCATDNTIQDGYPRDDAHSETMSESSSVQDDHVTGQQINHHDLSYD